MDAQPWKWVTKHYRLLKLFFILCETLNFLWEYLTSQHKHNYFQKAFQRISGTVNNILYPPNKTNLYISKANGLPNLWQGKKREKRILRGSTGTSKMTGNNVQAFRLAIKAKCLWIYQLLVFELKGYNQTNDFLVFLFFFLFFSFFLYHYFILHYIPNK